jgi:apolipoprotein N-acyltransferase
LLNHRVTSEPATALPADDPYAKAPAYWTRRWDRVIPVLVAVLTVVLAVGSFPPYEMSEFAYAMLVPGIFWAYLRPGFKVYALTLLGAQMVAWTIILGWLHHVSWLGLFLLGPFTGVWVGVWYLAAWWTIPRMFGRSTPVRLVAVLALAGLWVVIEWTRTWFLSGFPWLPLAASQWKRISILQIAAYTGAGGVSFVLVAMNLGFAAYAHRLFREEQTGFSKRSQEFFLAMFLLLTCLAVYVQETVHRTEFAVRFLRVGLVQPYIPQTLKWDPASAPDILGALEKTTLQAASVPLDLILWPEAVTPWAVRGDASVQAWTERLAQRAKTPLLIGSIGIEDVPGAGTVISNGAFLIKPQGGLQVESYRKRHLVPFGEFVPFRPVLGWLSKIVPIGDGDILPGTTPSLIEVTAADGTTAEVGSLICYEDVFPALARSSVQAGADVLVVLTNNGWFGEDGAAVQHAAHSVLRAVETRRPVLRVGNGGWSGWIDEFGYVRYTATNEAGSIYFRGARAISVSRDQRWIGLKSFYVEHGDWFVAASALVAAFGWMLLRVSVPHIPQNAGADSDSG